MNFKVGQKVIIKDIILDPEQHNVNYSMRKMVGSTQIITKIIPDQFFPIIIKGCYWKREWIEALVEKKVDYIDNHVI